MRSASCVVLKGVGERGARGATIYMIEAVWFSLRIGHGGCYYTAKNHPYPPLAIFQLRGKNFHISAPPAYSHVGAVSDLQPSRLQASWTRPYIVDECKIGDIAGLRQPSAASAWSNSSNHISLHNVQVG